MMDEKVLSMKEYINEAEAALLHTYNTLPGGSG